MHPDFFAAHSSSYPFLMLLGLAFFPRITLLFVGGPFGLLQWVGWAFMPHFTVALIATFRYWDTNPWLVVIAWCFALGGTSVEGKAASKTSRRRRSDDETTSPHERTKR